MEREDMVKADSSRSFPKRWEFMFLKAVKEPVFPRWRSGNVESRLGL
jgi:hypothetical protein